jgi:hypothetical protein
MVHLERSSGGDTNSSTTCIGQRPCGHAHGLVGKWSATRRLLQSSDSRGQTAWAAAAAGFTAVVDLPGSVANARPGDSVRAKFGGQRPLASRRVYRGPRRPECRPAHGAIPGADTRRRADHRQPQQIAIVQRSPSWMAALPTAGTPATSTLRRIEFVRPAAH